MRWGGMIVPHSAAARPRDHRHARLAIVLLAFLLSACGAAPTTTSAARSAASTATASGPVPTATVAPTATPSRASVAPGSAAPPTAVPPAREAATVVRVIDGDTIAVRFADGHTDTVRYIGIDTPETKDPRTTVECFGEAASAKNGELDAGRAVALEKDTSERDRYDRLLRYVWVTGGDGAERFANAELVQWGFAAASSYPPDVRHQETFRSLQQAAQAQRLGLWGACRSAHDPLPVAAPPTAVPPAVAPAPPPTAPAPIPTGKPPVAQPTAPPVAPASAAQLVATVSNASPTKNTRVTVTATLTDDGGRGLAGATMRTVWHYKTTTSACAGGPSGADGCAGRLLYP